MTTTEKLREALQAVEPGWVVPNADMLRKRARLLRLRRRIASVVALALGVTTGVAAGPHLLPKAGDGPTTAALGRGTTVPTTVSEASAITDLEIREGGLPYVRRSGRIVTVTMTQVQYQLRSPVSAWYAVGDLCEMTGSCVHLETRDPGGWVAVTETSMSTASDDPLIGPSQLVVETPVAGVVAAVDGARIPAELTNLGQGYTLVSLSTAAMTSGAGDLATRPVKVWAFSPRGELVARYPG